MSIHTTAEHKNTAASSDNNLSQSNNLVETYPATPIVHGVTIFVQLDDDNELYEFVEEKQREWNKLRTAPATKDNPHLVASEYTPSWDKQGRQCEVGFFASKTGYGKLADDGSLIRCSDHHLGLYQNALTAEKPPLPAKCKLVIEKREAGLQTNSGKEFGWPPGANGQRWEGSYLKIQTSYITEPVDAVKRAEEMLSVAFEGFDSLCDFGAIIPEMCRVQGIEAYVRYICDVSEQTIRELEKSADLTTKADTDGKKIEQYSNNECTNFRLLTNRMGRLGFDTANLEQKPKKIELKTYAATNYTRRKENDPLRHWKLEATIYGAYPWDQWPDLLQHARRIVCSHAIWAGIREEELVSDEWFLANDQSRQGFAFQHPINRREQLLEFYQSERFERTVRGHLFHSRTKSYHDLLCILLNQEDDQLSYQKAVEEIGLTKDSIGRIAGRLEEDGIVNRCISSEGFIRWQTQQAKTTVQALLNRDTTEAERRSAIETRADERRRKREEQSEESGKKQDVQWVEISESEVNAEELANRLLSGDLTSEDVFIRPGG